MAKRKRILCVFDGEEQVVFGTIRYEMSKIDTCDSIAIIVDEDCEDSPIRINEHSVLEVTDAPLKS